MVELQEKSCARYLRCLDEYAHEMGEEQQERTHEARLTASKRKLVFSKEYCIYLVIQRKRMALNTSGLNATRGVVLPNAS